MYILQQVDKERLSCSISNNTSTTNNITKKLILYWTSKYHNWDLSLEELNRHYNQRICPYFQCEIIFNRSQLCSSSAVVFHLRDTFINDLPPARKRLHHQRYVLWSQEPPYFTPAFVARMNSYFNWTMTYRHDSDILHTYIHWRKRSSRFSTTNKNYLKNRLPRILWIASNCASDSHREDYIYRLSKIVSTTVLGKCRHSLSLLASASCDKLSLSECLTLFSKNHTYYFAFENSFCLDYITEKYQLQVDLKVMIPIVYDTEQNKNYKRLAIPNSYIDASQFQSPELLGEYLRNLTLPDSDGVASSYDDYFQWINQYDLADDNQKLHHTCELCRKLHVDSQSTKTYDNMKKWLFEDANCYQWSNKHNRSIKVPLSETIRFTNRVMDETLSIASV